MTRFCSVVTLAALTLSLPAAAATPESAVKYRQAVMKSQGGHMSAINALANGEVEHKDHLLAHAQAIADTAKMVRVIFPAGSDKGETDALPGIWTMAAVFQKSVEALEAAAPKLEDAAKSGKPDAVKAAFGEVGKACKGCHDDFRKKK